MRYLLVIWLILICHCSCTFYFWECWRLFMILLNTLWSDLHEVICWWLRCYSESGFSTPTSLLSTKTSKSAWKVKCFWWFSFFVCVHFLGGVGVWGWGSYILTWTFKARRRFCDLCFRAELQLGACLWLKQGENWGVSEGAGKPWAPMSAWPMLAPVSTSMDRPCRSSKRQRLREKNRCNKMRWEKGAY